MLKSYLCHLTVDSVVLTSQEISMTQDHLHLEYPCTHLHQGKGRSRNNLCNWSQLAQRSEMFKVPEVMLVPCESLSDSIYYTKLKVCIALSGVRWKYRWMVDGLAKEKLLQCRRSQHEYYPTLSSMLIHLWDLRKSLLFQIFAVISIMSWHLWICRYISHFLPILVLHCNLRNRTKQINQSSLQNATNQLCTTVLVLANLQEDVNNNKNVFIMREIREIASLR